MTDAAQINNTSHTCHGPEGGVGNPTLVGDWVVRRSVALFWSWVFGLWSLISSQRGLAECTEMCR